MIGDKRTAKTDCVSFRSMNGKFQCDCMSDLVCTYRQCKSYSTDPMERKAREKFGGGYSRKKDFNNRRRIDGKFIKAKLETCGLSDLHKAAIEIGLSYRSIYDAVNRNMASQKTISMLTKYLDIPEKAILI